MRRRRITTNRQRTDIFTRNHVAIPRDQYCFLSKAGFYDRDHVTLTEVKPNIKQYDTLLHRVGRSYGWNLRPKYVLDRKALRERLKAPTSRFFLAYKGNHLIGYCFVSQCENSVGCRLHNVIEIENFGLFPEYTGRRLGHSFLTLVFDELFKTYDNVYLTTRSTNHRGVISFYESMGMRVIYTEELACDLVRNASQQRYKTA